jgi:hypothetical protein
MTNLKNKKKNYITILICGGIQILMYFLVTNDLDIIETNLPTFLLGNYSLGLFLFPFIFLFVMLIFRQFINANYCNLFCWIFTIIYCFFIAVFIFACFYFTFRIAMVMSHYPVLEHGIFGEFTNVVSVTFYAVTEIDPILVETSFVESHTVKKGADFLEISISPSRFFLNYLEPYLGDGFFEQQILKNQMKSAVVELIFKKPQ